MATGILSRTRKDGTGRSGVILPRSPAAGTEKKQKNEDEDPEKVLRREQQVQRALRNWNLYKKLEKEDKLAYLSERVKLQRELIDKSNALVGRLQEEAEEKRREMMRSKRREKQSVIDSIKEKERKIQEHRRRIKEVLNTSTQQDQTNGGTEDVPYECTPMDPPSGRSTHQMTFSIPASPLASVSSSSNTSDGNFQTKNPKLAQIIKELGGQVEVESMWNRLKMKNDKKLEKRRLHCQRLRSDSTMSPFLKQCLITYDLPLDKYVKYQWDDIRQQSHREEERRHSFPPISGTPGSRSSKHLIDLMYHAAVENEYNASIMLTQKKFRQSIVDGSVSDLIPKDLLRLDRDVPLQGSEKREGNGDTQDDTEQDRVSSGSDLTSKQSIFITTNVSQPNVPKPARVEHITSKEHVEHLPTIVEEKVAVAMPLPPPREGCVRTFSAQSMGKHGRVLLSHHEGSAPPPDKHSVKDQRTWHPLDCHALTDSKVLKTHALAGNGTKGFRHGASVLWKVPS